jgi:hypothetical protein
LALGALFFMLGVSQLAELVGYPDDLAFNIGYYIMFLGFAPAMVGGVLVIYQKARYEKQEEGPTEGVDVVPFTENSITDEHTVIEEDEE